MTDVDLRLPDYESMRHYPSWTDPVGQLIRPGDLGFWPVAYGSSYRIHDEALIKANTEYRAAIAAANADYDHRCQLITLAVQTATAEHRS